MNGKLMSWMILGVLVSMLALSSTADAATATWTSATNNWTAGPGTYWSGGGGGRYDQGSPGMFAGGYTCYGTAACRDGTSNTLLLGDQLPVYGVHMMYFHSHLNCATTNVPPNYWLINPRGCPPAPVGEVIPYCFRDMSGYNSMHRGGVNVALADGSVRFVGDTVDYVTWQYLGNKNDGKPVDASKF